MTLRELRESRKLTQAELADQSGCEQTTISQLELGKVRDPRYSTIEAIAGVLNTTPAVVAAAIRATEAA